jgi:hypothetical protein
VSQGRTIGALVAGVLATAGLATAGLVIAPRPAAAAAVSHQTGLAGRLVVGYQGWWGCPQDVASNTNWVHWFDYNSKDKGWHLTVDAFPSVGGFDKSDLCPATGLKTAAGKPIRVYSNQNRNIVDTEFRWMKEANIEGIALNQFIVDLEGNQDRLDTVLRNVRAAAEKNGRAFYLLYDVSNLDYQGQDITGKIERAWRHAVNDLKVTASPSYLYDHGKPVLEIWGYGFTDRTGEPAQVLRLIQALKQGKNGLQAVRLIGGVPTYWRTLQADTDTKTDPAWARVYRSFDVLSPWEAGRFSDQAGADQFLKDVINPDIAETKRLGIGYMPVIWPGYSFTNTARVLGLPVARHPLNEIPRQGGNFYWRQAYNYLSKHVDMLYVAMFDEFDESTQITKTVPTQAAGPQGGSAVALDQDGYRLPDDWYLRITATIARALKAATVPPQRLATAMAARAPEVRFTAPPWCGALEAGRRLTAGQSVVSCNQRYRLTVTADGNLVEYALARHRVLWSSQTTDRSQIGDVPYLVLQPDTGELVLVARDGHTLWSSSRASGSAAATVKATYLAVQDNGTLAVRDVVDAILWSAPSR